MVLKIVVEMPWENPERQCGFDFNAQIKRVPLRGTSRRLFLLLFPRFSTLYASLEKSEVTRTFLENKLKSWHARGQEFNYCDRAIRPNERHLCPTELRVMSYTIFIYSIRSCHRSCLLFFFFLSSLLSYFLSFSLFLSLSPSPRRVQRDSWILAVW